MYKYLTGGNEDEGARLFSVMPSDKTRGNGHKLKHRRFPLNIRKHFCTVGVIEHWNRLPTEVAESPSLKILKKTTGCSPEQPAVVNPALSRGVEPETLLRFFSMIP